MARLFPEMGDVLVNEQRLDELSHNLQEVAQTQDANTGDKLQMAVAEGRLDDVATLEGTDLAGALEIAAEVGDEADFDTLELTPPELALPEYDAADVALWSDSVKDISGLKLNQAPAFNADVLATLRPAPVPEVSAPSVQQASPVYQQGFAA